MTMLQLTLVSTEYHIALTSTICIIIFKHFLFPYFLSLRSYRLVRLNFGQKLHTWIRYFSRCPFFVTSEMKLRSRWPTLSTAPNFSHLLFFRFHDFLVNGSVDECIFEWIPLFRSVHIEIIHDHAAQSSKCYNMDSSCWRFYVFANISNTRGGKLNNFIFN